VKEKRNATLDLTDCKKWPDFHQRIKNALKFPDFYGCNWSAFWDSLRFDSPVDYIYIVGVDTVSEEIQECVQKMCEILDRCKAERASLGWDFGYEIVN